MPAATQPRAHSLRSRDPAQLALAILTDYFRAKSGGSALAEALYEPLYPADLSESIVAAIAGMLREAFSMSRAYAASLVELHYTGLHAPA